MAPQGEMTPTLLYQEGTQKGGSFPASSLLPQVARLHSMESSKRLQIPVSHKSCQLPPPGFPRDPTTPLPLIGPGWSSHQGGGCSASMSAPRWAGGGAGRVGGSAPVPACAHLRRPLSSLCSHLPHSPVRSRQEAAFVIRCQF